MSALLRIFSLVFLGLFVSKIASAQDELIRPLRSNASLRKSSEHNSPSYVQRTSAMSIVLPFVDDFSGKDKYPDPLLWQDRAVYINSHMARNMLTIGVATFDGLNDIGDPYDNSFSTSQGSCDTLTSQPIQLNLNKKVNLSFMVQRKGWGDPPDLTDSLILEFFNPSDSLWSRKWFIKGGLTSGQDTLFEPYWVSIDSNSVYQQDGFRFRFRSHGARTGALDHWHLDYVRLYQAFDPTGGTVDSLWSDVAMTSPIKSLLADYTAVPWTHFNSLTPVQQEGLIIDSSAMYYRVTDDQPADVGFNHRIFNHQGTLVSSFGATNGNIFPGRPNNIFLDYSFPVSQTTFPSSPSLSADSTYFIVKNFFSNGNAFPGLKSNDTTEFQQVFYNYYSFDDGSAEGGYDLIGTNMGKVAMRFDFLQPDTLRAIQFFFAQYGDTVTNLLFNLKIWTSLNPETTLYQKPNQRARYADSLYGYATYFLDQPLYVSGPVYIGFQQQQNFPSGIHLGFDKNTSSNSRMFYNVGSGWTNTTVANGTFMIRPVFGDSYGITSLHEDSSELAGFNVYPNPVNDRIQLQLMSGIKPERLLVRDVAGRILYSGIFTDAIDCSHWTSGQYLISIYYVDGRSANSRFIIAR